MVTQTAQPVMSNSSNMLNGGYENPSYQFGWSYPEEDSLSSTHNRLQQLNQIPQPIYYADNDKGPKDSGYWSSAPGDMDVNMDPSMPSMNFDPLNLPQSGYEVLADLAAPGSLHRDIYMGGDDLSLNDLNLNML